MAYMKLVGNVHEFYRGHRLKRQVPTLRSPSNYIYSVWTSCDGEYIDCLSKFISRLDARFPLAHVRVCDLDGMFHTVEAPRGPVPRV